MIPSAVFKNVEYLGPDLDGHRFKIGARDFTITTLALLGWNNPEKWEFDWGEAPPMITGQRYTIDVRESWVTKNGLTPDEWEW